MIKPVPISTEDFLLIFGHKKATFQAGSDIKKVHPTLKRGKLLHGTIQEVETQLQTYNRRHGFVSFTPNTTDLQGRGIENMIKVNAYFADLDGEELLALNDYPLRPSVVVNTSPNKYHLYWLVDNAPLDQFFHVQTHIATLLNSCMGVRQVNHAMRMPNFFHMKNTPYRVNVIHVSPDRYDNQQFWDFFMIPDLPPPRKIIPPLPAAAAKYVQKYSSIPELKSTESGRAKLLDNIRFAPEGTRNQTLLAMARALANDVVSGSIDEDYFKNSVLNAGLDAGLGHNETQVTMNQALNYARKAN